MQDSAAALKLWYQQPLGEQVFDEQQQFIASLLPQLFGYHALQIDGAWCYQSLLQDSPIKHHTVLELSKSEPGGVQGTPEHLPFATDSVDLVLLFHTLENCSDPHQVLREVYRVLIPDGHLIIVGFNPLSLWGIWKLLVGWFKSAPWNHHFFVGYRLLDWSRLLGMEVLKNETIFFRPPITNIKILQKLQFMDKYCRRFLSFSGAQRILLARKRIVPLTPIVPRWQPKVSFLGGAVEPTTRKGGY